MHVIQAQQQSMEMSSEDNEEHYASVEGEESSQLEASVC